MRNGCGREDAALARAMGELIDCVDNNGEWYDEVKAREILRTYGDARAREQRAQESGAPDDRAKQIAEDLYLGRALMPDDAALREQIVMLDLSRHTETMFSKMDGLDKATFNILVKIARDAARAEQRELLKELYDVEGHATNCGFRGCTCGAVERRAPLRARLASAIRAQEEKG